jgi:DNA processing protein
MKEKINLKFAIVGTRTPTKYGREMAYKFSFFLAKNGVTIVSGLARGIDTIAHQAALDAGGKTIAVLGSGKDIIYPPENKKLALEIAKHGEVISPFPDGTKPLPGNFLIRNELIVRLSLGVLVIEGRERSGTLSTSTHAANLGVEVFAIPGPINSPQSYLPNYLIKNGATLVTSPEEVLDSIGKLTFT